MTPTISTRYQLRFLFTYLQAAAVGLRMELHTTKGIDEGRTALITEARTILDAAEGDLGGDLGGDTLAR